jgi:phosphoglycolate phosphatase-like HAD superfamily hydrolase
LQLHAQGVPLILVTLRRQEQAIQMLQRFGIAHLFTQIHGAKDDEAAYQNQAEHKTQLLANAVAAVGLGRRSFCNFNQPTPSAWMVGDTEADILAGQALNIPTIALTCGIRSQTYLQRFVPTYVHRDLASAAHYLVRSAQVAA